MHKLRQVFLKGSILKVWIGSNIFILIIPLIISIIVYLESFHIIQNAVNQYNAVLLNQVQHEIDRRISEIEQLSIQVNLSDNIRSLIWAQKHIELQHYYNINRIQNELNAYKVANGFIGEIFVYYTGIDKIVGSNKNYNVDLLKTGIIDDSGVNYDQWRKIKTQYHNNELLYIPAKNNSRGHVLYIQSLRFNNTTDIPAILVVVLDNKHLIDNSERFKWLENGLMFIINQDDNIVSYSAADSNLPIIKYKDLQEGHLTYFNQDGKNLVITCINSKYQGWKYAFAFPAEFFVEKTEYIRKLIFAGIFLCLLFGGGVAYLIAKKNYKPVNDLLKAVSGEKPVQSNESNEFRLIQESIRKAFDENKKINKELGQQKETLKYSFLSKLIKGTVSWEGQVEHIFADYGVIFESEYFAVLLFYIEDFGDLFDVNDERNRGEEITLARFIIRNIVEELVSKHHKGYMTDVDGFMACMVNLNTDRVNNGCAQDDLMSISNEVYRIINMNYHIDFSIAISEIHEGISFLAKAYHEALDATEYRIMFKKDIVTLYSNIGNTGKSYDYPLKDEQLLVNYIKLGDEENALQMLDHIFTRNFEGKTISINEAKCLIFDLHGTVLKLLQDVKITHNCSGLDSVDILKGALKLRTVLEAKDGISRIIKKICNYINSNKTDRSQEISEGIIIYVDQHYMESDLAIVKIADSFSITSSYLSKVFKECMGKSILDYISEVRLAEAKKLMADGNKSISFIAEQVGYIDSSALIRTFKKYEGITPGKYRKINSDK